jgi:Flp pilus assembly protein TadB
VNGRLGAVTFGATCLAAGVWVIATALGEPSVSLEAAVRRLRRVPSPEPATDAVGRLGQLVVRLVPGGRAPWAGAAASADLAAIGRSSATQAAMLCSAVLVGFVAPSLVLGLAAASGAVSPGWFVPVGVALCSALAAPLAVQADLRTRARLARRDLRHQLSAFLDVVTMLLAGNVGNEGALRHAAAAGDGRLFVELRRRMTEAETVGRPMVEALGALGEQLGIAELQQIAASASLASSEGAPVARSLAAKCATLRSCLAAEDEAAARVRTGKLSLPLVGMGLVIMALVIYPALSVRP